LMARMFRGELRRADGLTYQGDPFDHPLHNASTSYGGQFARGANLDWPGGPSGGRPDLLGWHWYPFWPRTADWTEAWTYTLDGVASFSAAPLGAHARLISEFGTPDRTLSTDMPSLIYPTLYHHAIWATVLGGHAGSAMDWDDGKEFGELRWRDQPGPFDRSHYPIDHVAQMQALRRFLGSLRPDDLWPCTDAKARIRCLSVGDVRIFALGTRGRPDAVYGWLFAPGEDSRFRIEGLTPGSYVVTWVDPWTGEALPDSQRVVVEARGPIELDARFPLASLHGAARAFVNESRLDQGCDIAFKLVSSAK
jgi:hypothetical protein